MCMGIPMQILEINGFGARCEAKGFEREVSLLMLDPEDLAVGDFVVIHLGHAIEKISAERAADAWSVYDEMLAAEDTAVGGEMR
ncbi:MAG: HypC/HybG/HupF family hydrogenase formation chaperone [Lamprobacter sp.]|uniref:HypC/HybG/HupF family hydrogenase formation chaperone n=1 Tax=Lamprobacter sp. TaxID=3100796 RepID=UPI002B25ED61|nr:HypC/HybG/HupF family hydrogenase formation chaperone [Lamprobacter sp.]MEA3639597.1 HypC/HybG/HupF family hydrogenase formation chaperone [Lamprobacter sp.]